MEIHSVLLLWLVDCTSTTILLKWLSGRTCLAMFSFRDIGNLGACLQCFMFKYIHHSQNTLSLNHEICAKRNLKKCLLFTSFEQKSKNKRQLLKMCCSMWHYTRNSEGLYTLLWKERWCLKLITSEKASILVSQDCLNKLPKQGGLK